MFCASMNYFLGTGIKSINQLTYESQSVFWRAIISIEMNTQTMKITKKKRKETHNRDAHKLQYPEKVNGN